MNILKPLGFATRRDKIWRDELKRKYGSDIDIDVDGVINGHSAAREKRIVGRSH
jgi:hypothetical protein